MATFLQLNAADQARYGYTHKSVITFADLTALFNQAFNFVQV